MYSNTNKYVLLNFPHKGMLEGLPYQKILIEFVTHIIALHIEKGTLLYYPVGFRSRMTQFAVNSTYSEKKIAYGKPGPKNWIHQRF